AKPVDPQSVVAAILRRPLLVIDQARRDFLKLKVRHLVAADDHRTLFAAENVDHARQRRLVFVQIIAVKLHRESAASRVEQSLVPAAADTEVEALRDEVNHALVPRREIAK